MPSGKHLTTDLHARIIELHEAGHSYKSAARQLNIPLGTYAGWLHKCRHQKGMRIHRNAHIDRTGRRLVTTTVTLPKLKFMEQPDG
jgi:transposase-like protein